MGQAHEVIAGSPGGLPLGLATPVTTSIRCRAQCAMRRGRHSGHTPRAMPTLSVSEEHAHRQMLPCTSRAQQPSVQRLVGSGPASFSVTLLPLPLSLVTLLEGGCRT